MSKVPFFFKRFCMRKDYEICGHINHQCKGLGLQITVMFLDLGIGHFQLILRAALAPATRTHGNFFYVWILY